MTKENFPFQAKITETISDFNGTLYKDDIVAVQSAENGDYRVTDNIGKIWYVLRNKVKRVK